MKKDMKVSNPSPTFEHYAQAIFQFSPLKDMYKYELSTEAIDCCASAIHILQSIYHKAELTIQTLSSAYSSFMLNSLFKD